MDLDKMRKEIDDIDLEILRLIAKRFEIAVRTKRLKSDIQDEQREISVKNNVKNNAKFLLKPEFCEKLFSQIIQESRLIQNTTDKLIGFVGVHGNLSELAVQNASSISIPCDTYSEIFEGIKLGVLDGGIIPIDRSIEDSAENCLVDFLDSGLSICNQFEAQSNYCLMTLPTTDYRDIKIVYSHPNVLSCAQDFIARTKLQSEPFHSSAHAALMLSSNKTQACAVIAPEECAKIYNLAIVKENILSKSFSTARFIEVSKTTKDSGANCAVYFEVCQTSGSLNNVLKIFTDKKINLSKIESLPTSDKTRAKFFVEFNLDGTNISVDVLLKSINSTCEDCRLLGIF
jgi:prephenate dehydratase/chorismate mutase